MQPLDVFWHVLNFFAPAVGVGLLAPLFAKTIWRTGLASTGWRALIAWTTAASAAVLIGGMVVFEHDGKTATYAAMVLAAGVAMWWVGFRAPRQ